MSLKTRRRDLTSSVTTDFNIVHGHQVIVTITAISTRTMIYFNQLLYNIARFGYTLSHNNRTLSKRMWFNPLQRGLSSNIIFWLYLLFCDKMSYIKTTDFVYKIQNSYFATRFSSWKKQKQQQQQQQFHYGGSNIGLRMTRLRVRVRLWAKVGEAAVRTPTSDQCLFFPLPVYIKLD